MAYPCRRRGGVGPRLLGVSLTTAQSAAAATPLAPVDASVMKLTAGDFTGRWAAIDALEKSGRVTSYTTQPALAPLFDPANGGTSVTGVAGLCHESNLNTAYSIGGFC